jgi:hypothetical protein
LLPQLTATSHNHQKFQKYDIRYEGFYVSKYNQKFFDSQPHSDGKEI